MNPFRRPAGVVCVALGLCCAAVAFWLSGQYVVPVMMYHSISDRPLEPLNTVSPAVFRRQMDFLARHGYRVISPDEYVEGIHAGRRFPRGTVVISFDDGYDDNYTAAWPVLREYGFPAVIFMPSLRAGGERKLTWDQLRRMSQDGLVSIGSHMRDESYLPGLPQGQWVEQIAGSKRELEAGLGRPVRLISYPIGGFSDVIKQIARDAGYRGAFATNRGFDRRGRDPYEIKRIRIKNNDGALALWVKLSGYYNLTRSSQNPY